MRKVVLALALTAVGLALLLSFKSRSGGSVSTVTPSTKPSASSSAHSPSSSSSTSKSASGTFTGTSIDTRYGPVQVQAVLSDGKLTNVNVLQVPDNGGYEDQIVSIALPELKSEALSDQSANIDVVSGATFTSQGYAQSLQSALDQAGL
jgi:uncharacterized protein with FMN-binding domain